jgi:hypothetical protein
MTLFNNIDSVESSSEYLAVAAGADFSIGDVLVNTILQQNNAVQVSQWFNRTTNSAIATPAPAAIELNVPTFKAKSLMGEVVSTLAEGLRPLGQVLATVDTQQISEDSWLAFSSNSSISEDSQIGLSVSNDGIVWEDLYASFSSGLPIYFVNGALAGTNALVASNLSYYLVKPFTRFIRFIEVAGGTTYGFTVNVSGSHNFSVAEVQSNSNISFIANNTSYVSENYIYYVVLTAATGFAVGDIARRVTRASTTTPANILSTRWDNATQKTNNVTPPPLANIIEQENIRDKQNVIRLVNSTASSQLVKTTNAYLKDIYIDNLGAQQFLQIFQGLAAAPVNGAVPTECYRIPANGTVGLSLNRVYTGQVHLAFSSTAATLTLLSVAKNAIIGFN